MLLHLVGDAGLEPARLYRHLIFKTTLCHHSHISVLQSGLCLYHTISGLGSRCIVSTHLGITSTQHGVLYSPSPFSRLLLLSFPIRHSLRIQRSPLFKGEYIKVKGGYLLHQSPIYNTRYKILCIFLSLNLTNLLQHIFSCLSRWYFQKSKEDFLEQSSSVLQKRDFCSRCCAHNTKLSFIRL